MDVDNLTDFPKVYSCTMCRALYHDINALGAHVKLCFHNGENPFKKFRCNVCGCEFACARNLAKHAQKWHPNELPTHAKPFQCNFCADRFVFKGDLSHHINDVHASMPRPTPKCPTCEREFLSEKTLRGHMKLNRCKLLRCHLCQKVFYSPPKFDSH